MIKQWIDFFLSLPGDIIEFLDEFTLWGNVTVLGVLVASIVAGIITATFLSVARR